MRSADFALACWATKSVNIAAARTMTTKVIPVIAQFARLKIKTASRISRPGISQRVHPRLKARVEALALAAARLQEMAEIVKGTPVRILVETHDDWMRADDMKALMSACWQI